MIVKARNVTKNFGLVKALDDVSADIPQGAFFALLGPSGCGKTTLLRMFGGFDEPSQGTIEIDGRDMHRVPPNKRPVNMVFQSYAVFPHLSVQDNIAYGLRVTGTANDEVAKRVAEAIAMTRLDGMAGRMPTQLSGGQRQRVALARALVKRPKLLLLDEPLSALDKNLRENMQLELVRLQQEVGITFVIVTHDQAEALAMASQIAVMNQGRIVQQAPPRDLYERPQSRFVAEFIGASNFFDCGIEDAGSTHARVTIANIGTFEVEKANEQITSGQILLRPEKIRMSSSPTTAKIGEMVMAATVSQITYQGDVSHALLDLGHGQTVQCSHYNTGRTGRGHLAPGDACHVSFHPEDMLLVSD